MHTRRAQPSTCEARRRVTPPSYCSPHVFIPCIYRPLASEIPIIACTIAYVGTHDVSPTAPVGSPAEHALCMHQRLIQVYFQYRIQIQIQIFVHHTCRLTFRQRTAYASAPDPDPGTAAAADGARIRTTATTAAAAGWPKKEERDKFPGLGKSCNCAAYCLAGWVPLYLMATRTSDRPANLVQSAPRLVLCRRDSHMLMGRHHCSPCREGPTPWGECRDWAAP